MMVAVMVLAVTSVGQAQGGGGGGRGGTRHHGSAQGFAEGLRRDPRQGRFDPEGVRSRDGPAQRSGARRRRRCAHEDDRDARPSRTATSRRSSRPSSRRSSTRSWPRCRRDVAAADRRLASRRFASLIQKARAVHRRPAFFLHSGASTLTSVLKQPRPSSPPHARRADACAVSSSICRARVSTTTPPARAASGNPVVFIHGFPTSGHLWSEVVSLMPPGHRLVVLDLLGYGRSDRPLSRAVDASAHADRVVALLDELRIERACIVGHGFGGGVAQCIAVRHAARVSHLGLIDSIAFDRWPIARLRVSRALLPLAPLIPHAFLLSRLRHEVERGFGDRVRAARSIDIYVRPFAGPEGALALVAHIKGLSIERARRPRRPVVARHPGRRRMGAPRPRAAARHGKALAAPNSQRDARRDRRRPSLHAGRNPAPSRRLDRDAAAPLELRRSSSAASTAWPMSRDSARASCVAFVLSSICDPSPDDRSLSRSSFKFCNISPALSSWLESDRRRSSRSASEFALALQQRLAPLALRRVRLGLERREPLVQRAERRAGNVGVETMERRRHRRRRAAPARPPSARCPGSAPSRSRRTCS